MRDIGSFRRGLDALAIVAGVLVLMLHGCAWLRGSAVGGPSFQNSEIGSAYRNGEAALNNGDYVKARRTLMQVISQFPGENDLAQIQWLIAQSYELEGRTDEAIAEYKRFMRNYPTHPNAADADDRIRRLERGVVAKRVGPRRRAVRLSGNLSTDYEYGAQFDPSSEATMDRLSARLDVQIRGLDDGRGKVVFSGLHTRDFLEERNNRARLYKLYADWHNTADTTTLRAGRQPGTPGGLSTRYDGLEAHYRPVPSLSIDAAAGFPIDLTTQATPTTDRYFYEAGMTLLDAGGLTGRAYAVRHLSWGLVDREAVGGNVQGLWGRVGAAVNLDYDLRFAEFNDRFLSLDVAVTDAFHITVAQDLRKDPYLQLSTALLDPNAVGFTLDQWVRQQGEEAVRESAAFRTIDSTDRRIGIRWTGTSPWSVNADYAHGASDIGTADAAGAPSRTTRTFDRVSLYLAYAGGWFPDTASLLAIHQTSSDLNTETLYLTATDRLTRWMSTQLKARLESTNFKIGGALEAVRYVPGFSVSIEPSPSWSLTAEGEYIWEDRRYDATFRSLFSRLNLTVTF